MFSFWGFSFFCFQFVSYGVFGLLHVLIINTLTQLLPFELFSKKFCLNISELGFEIV